MELLTTVAPEFAENQMEAKNLLFGDARYQAVPNRYRLLGRWEQSHTDEPTAS